MPETYFLFDSKFKHPNAVEIEHTLNHLIQKYNIKQVDLSHLSQILLDTDTSAIITPYGAYFPIDAFPAFLQFLERGSSWLNIGGPPLRRPFYHPEDVQSGQVSEQNSYHRALGIYHYPKVEARRFHSYSANPGFPKFEELAQNLPFSDVHEMYYTLVNERDRVKLDVFTNPTGEAQHLIMARGEGDRPLAAAVMLWDHLWGRFNGSRWILINWEMTTEIWRSESFMKLIEEAISLLKQGAVTVKLRPVFASYFPNEKATLKLYARAASRHRCMNLKLSGLIFVERGEVAVAVAVAGEIGEKLDKCRGEAFPDIKQQKFNEAEGNASPSMHERPDTTSSANSRDCAAPIPDEQNARGSNGSFENGMVRNEQDTCGSNDPFEKGMAQGDESAEEGFRLGLRLRAGAGEISTFSAEIKASNIAEEKYILLDLNLSPGFYRFLAEVEFDDGNRQILQSGFWCYDEELLTQPVELKAGHDFILQDGQPLPIVGTSYMASDVHRWAWVDPNPSVWMDDFAEMKDAGMNMLRSGIWFGERHLLPNYGLGGEVTLRAFDAFVQTAVYHRLPLILTLMAFAPGYGCGESPWFDPASILWQKELIGQFVRRYRACNWLIWDIINEPSMSNPKRLWTTRPNYDAHELQAWQKWLEKKHGTIENLQLAWDVTAAELPDFSSAALPSELDFQDQNWTLDAIKQQKAIDYMLFVQDHFRAWLKEHVDAIRQMGAKQLTTMGQTEHGATTAPNPAFHSDVIDMTAMHSWSMNDDVIWKLLQTRAPGVPHLFGETGSFPQEHPDKEMRRSEFDLFRLYERKFIYAFAAKSAGTIHWIWNTAPTNSGEKESAVGGKRGSGSEKDELITLRLLAQFVNANRDYFYDNGQEETFVVIPFANIFAPRSMANRAVQNALRTLFFDLKQPVSAVSEFQIDKAANAKLLILPSARTLSQTAWRSLLEKVEQGAVLLISGLMEFDEYFRHQPRLKEVGIDLAKTALPVTRDEFFFMNGNEVHARFTHEKQDIADKAVFADGRPPQVVEAEQGRGRIIFCPLPLELADDAQPMRAFYQLGFSRANIASKIEGRTNPALLIRPLLSGDFIIYTVISESDQTIQTSWKDVASGAEIEIEIPGKRAMMFILSCSGQLISAYFSGKLRVGEIALKAAATSVVSHLNSTNAFVMSGDGDGVVEMNGIGQREIVHNFIKQSDDGAYRMTIPNTQRFVKIKL